MSAAWARSKEVASTASGQSRSISLRISSSPGASGKGQLPRFPVGLGGLRAGLAARPAAGPLLGSVTAVALSPALVRVAHDLPLQLGEAIEDGLGTGRAAWHVDVD